MMLLLAIDVLKLTYDMPAIQPSLRDLGHSKLSPALKRRAIFTCPSGTARSVGDKPNPYPHDSATDDSARSSVILMVDETGLTNRYDIDIRWSPYALKEFDLPAFQKVVDWELGIEAKLVKRPHRMLIVEKVTKKPEGNFQSSGE